MRTLALRSSPPSIVRYNWRPLYYPFAILLLLAFQLSCGTQPAFAVLVSAFAMLTYFAVTACGGLATLAGLIIFYLALQNVLVSQVAKVVLWQPADNGLRLPVETMEVYVCAMAGIYLAAVAARKLGIYKRMPIFPPETDPARVMWTAYCFTALLVFQMVYLRTQNVVGTASYGNGLVGILTAAPFIGPMAVVASTAYIIVASRGRRSFGFLNAVSIVVPFVFSILGASREGLVTVVAMYFVTCYAFRFRFRFIHYAILFGGMYVAQFILFPYALYARSFVRTSDPQQNVRRATSLFMDVLADPVKYQILQDVTTGSKQKFVYYGKPMASLDRYSLIEVTDGIVDATLREGTTGLDSITSGFLMAMPRAFSPEKFVFSPGNKLAHREPGLVGKNDHSTGISTGFTSDSFSSDSWAGAVIIPFLMTLALICFFRFLVYDRIWHNVYALSLLWPLAHEYSEGAITGIIILLIQSPLLFLMLNGIVRFFVSSVMRTRERLRQVRQQGTLSPRAEIARGRSPFNSPS